MFGQSYLAGKATEAVVRRVTGNKKLGKVAHIVVSTTVSTISVDPAGHAASWADIALDSGDSSDWDYDDD